MTWYKTGTVSVTSGSNAVIGTGTSFIANSRVGDAFRGPDGEWYEVTNIASDTALSIAPNYQGPTQAAGVYSLAPMQGYVKDSADQLRQIVNQYGATLAGLGSVSTENVVPIAKGGTGANTVAAAVTALGLGSVSTENVVPVSKGGTGAKTVAAAVTALGLDVATITNANGTAIRFPDGTQICTGYVNAPSLAIVDVRGSCFAGPYLAPPMFASAFIQPPVTTMNIVGSTGLIWFTGAVAPTTTYFQGAYAMCAYSVTASAYISYMAVGRWK